MSEVALAGHAIAQAKAGANLSTPSPTGFTKAFERMDEIIITQLGDDIIFYAQNGGQTPAKYILTARPGSDNKPGLEMTDNVWANIDIYSTIIDVLESAVPGIAKTWTALYSGQYYAVSEIIRKGDGILTLILNQPGNRTPAPGGWR